MGTYLNLRVKEFDTKTHKYLQEELQSTLLRYSYSPLISWKIVLFRCHSLPTLSVPLYLNVSGLHRNPHIIVGFQRILMVQFPMEVQCLSDSKVEAKVGGFIFLQIQNFCSHQNRQADMEANRVEQRGQSKSSHTSSVYLV